MDGWMGVSSQIRLRMRPVRSYVSVLAPKTTTVSYVLVHLAMMPLLFRLSSCHPWLTFGFEAWFILPQLRTDGMSAQSKFFSISDKDEAVSYLAHPILGPRLIEATLAIAGSPARSITQLMGWSWRSDGSKLQSTMTLFA